ncbi:MAG TPA: hypothetical protein VD962_03740 [Rubricoccaceae bacterium]|nr:hypothetical protein [Rubricoccaceae bacterium]
MDQTLQNTRQKLKVHAILSATLTVAGAILLVYMITVESEPGAIPLLLIVLGVGWYLLTRARMRSQRQQLH